MPKISPVEPMPTSQTKSLTINKSDVDQRLRGAKVRLHMESNRSVAIQITPKDASVLRLAAQRRSAKHPFVGAWSETSTFELHTLRHRRPTRIECRILSNGPHEPTSGTWTADEDWP